MDDLDRILAGAENALAIVDPQGKNWTYGAIRARTARRLSELGDLTGRAVAIRHDDPATYLLDALAVFLGGGLAVPINLKAPTIRQDAVIARVGIHASRHHDPRAGVALSTSGSTGNPRLVLLPREGVLANVDAIRSYLPVSPGCRVGVVLPPWYSYTLVGQVMTALSAGATVVLLSHLGFATQQVEAFADQGIDGVSAVPTSLGAWGAVLRELPPKSRPRVSWWASAGGPWTGLERFADTVPEATLFHQYGLTEASPRVAALSSDHPAFRSGALRPIPGVQVTAHHDDGRPATPDDPGPLFVRSPSAMLGYLDDADATARVLATKGLRTGDLGWMDAEGLLHLAGREDDVVNIAGVRVSTLQIGGQIVGSGLVDDAWVTSEPDPTLGTRLVAWVTGPESKALRRWCTEHLAPAERPRRIHWVPELPRNAHGKLDRGALRRG